MFGKRLCLALLTVATVLSISAVAQDEKNEVGGLLGRTFISDQGIQNATYFDPIIHSGKGLTFQGEYARRFLVTPIYSISADGLDVKVWRKLSVRMDVRDFWAGEPDFPLAPTGKTRQHNFFVGGGAFWRF